MKKYLAWLALGALLLASPASGQRGPGVYTPESYGARCDGVTNDAPAFQAAINAAATGSEIRLQGGCVYLWTGAVTDTTGVYFVGVGRGGIGGNSQGTVIDFEPTVNGLAAFTAKDVIAGGIQKLMFTSADSAHTKTAILLNNVSGRKYEIKQVLINGTVFVPNVGSYWSSGGTGGNTSLGIEIDGRENVHVQEVTIIADLPLKVGYNTASNPIDLDVSEFYGVSMLAAYNNPCIFWRPGVVAGRVSFRDMWCGLSTHGFYWNSADGNTTATNGPYVAGTTTITVANAGDIGVGHPIALTISGGCCQIVFPTIVNTSTNTVTFTPGVLGGNTLANGAAVNVDAGISDSVQFDHFSDEQPWRVSASTSATTANGNPTLHFTAVPVGIANNMSIVDNTTGSVIPPNTTVVSFTSTTVTMSNNASGGGVGSGDTITFAADTTGTSIFFAPNANFYGLKITNSALDSRPCYNLRNVASALFTNNLCFGTTHLNADGTNGNIDFLNEKGTGVDSVTGLNTIFSVPATLTNGGLPDTYFLTSASPTSSGTRLKLTTATMLFASPSGSGSSCLSSSTPCSIQGAYNFAASSLDFNGQVVTIQGTVGSYAPSMGINCLAITSGWVGGGSLVIDLQSNGSSTCSTDTADAIAIFSPLPGLITFKGFKITTVNGGSNGISVQSPGVSGAYSTNFGAIAGAAVTVLSPGSLMQCVGPYTISGNESQHWAASAGGAIHCSTQTITVTGGPSFAPFAIAQDSGHIIANVTFSPVNTSSGTGTGQKYIAKNLGIIDTATGNANLFPGNAAGAPVTPGVAGVGGGQYQ